LSEQLDQTFLEKPYTGFLFKALYGIYEAWDEGDLRKALHRATRLIVFLPTDIKNALWPKRKSIVAEMNRAYGRNGVDWFTSQSVRNQSANRVAYRFLEPFVNQIVTLLDSKGWLEKGALRPRFKKAVPLSAKA